MRLRLDDLVDSQITKVSQIYQYLQALYYKKLHNWSKVMGPRRLRDGSSGFSFKTRLCCYEQTQKITVTKTSINMEDYQGIQYEPPPADAAASEAMRPGYLFTFVKTLAK